MTLTNTPEEKKTSVVPYKGFQKRRNRAGSATLGQEQSESREVFGYDPRDYVRAGHGNALPGKYGNEPLSGRSGGLMWWFLYEELPSVRD